MIDYGLLISIILAFAAPELARFWWPLRSYPEDVRFLDVALGPAAGGLVVGRITALGLDDPSSIGSLSDMAIIRSGVEFWPGVTVAVAVLALDARRAGLSPSTRIVDVAPLAMLGYAAYEASCVFRDGCFGPVSPVGLRPDGLTTTMAPIGWFVALAVVGGAIGIRHLSQRPDVPSWTIPILAVVLVAAARSVGSIWLPHVGEGLTRQHQTSIAIAAAATVVLWTGLARLGRLAGRSPL